MRYSLFYSFIFFSFNYCQPHFIMGKREICGFLYLSESPIYATVLRQRIGNSTAPSGHIDNDRGKEKASDLLFNKMVAISQAPKRFVTPEEAMSLLAGRSFSSTSSLSLIKKEACIISTINHAAVTARMIHQLDGNGSGCARAQVRGNKRDKK